MDRRHVLDTSLDKPDLDLLNMRGYARILADYIRNTRPPFTIGVYGDWGSGETSFVQFTKYYLEEPNTPPLKFIKFEAWPYQTSDELWRALIFTIAQELYENQRANPTKGSPIPWRPHHLASYPGSLSS